MGGQALPEVRGWRLVVGGVLTLWVVVDGWLLASFAGTPGGLGLDAYIYVRAAAAWLAGQDPWQAEHLGLTFAAPPPTLLVFAPLTLFPEELAVALVLIASAIAVVLTTRVLRFPLYWALFPPLFNSIVAGNLNAFIVLILVGAPTALRWVAPVMKVYAIVPVIGLRDWRTLAIFSAVVVVTAPFLPWGTFIGSYAEINAALTQQSSGGHSAWGSPLLMVAGFLSLVAIGLPRAAWLAVPVLWPSTQIHYASLATPVARPLVLAVLIALPTPYTTVLAVILFAFADRLQGRWPAFRILLRPV